MSAIVAPTEVLDIRVVTPSDRDEKIETAVRHLQELAKVEGTKGILLTRVSPGHYTAALSESVPFGMTRELVH